MQKIIPVSIKIIGIVLVLMTAIFPLIVVNMSTSWEGTAPPDAPDDFEGDVMKFTAISFEAKNVTYDNETNEFKIEPVDTSGSDAFSQAVRTLTLINTSFLFLSVIAAALGTLLTFIRGKTKLGGFFSSLGGFFMLLLAGWSMLIQNLLLRALTELGGEVSGNTLIIRLSTTVNNTTYTLIMKASISLGLGVYLALLGAIFTIISLFLKSDE